MYFGQTAEDAEGAELNRAIERESEIIGAVPRMFADLCPLGVLCGCLGFMLKCCTSNAFGGP